MKKKELLSASVLMIGVGFTSYAIIQNESLKSRKLREEENARQECFLKQSEAFYAKLPSSLCFLGPQRSSLSLSEFVDSTSRLGIYVDKTQFTSQGKIGLLNLEELLEGRKEILRPFVLLGNCHPRDLRLLQRQDSLFSLYGISLDSCETLYRLSQFATPFLFVLHPDGHMSDVFFLSNSIRPYLNAYIEKLINSFEGGIKTHDGRLVLLNPSVNVGEILLREQYKVVFRVKNVSEQTLEVQNVELSCDCLALEKTPSRLIPDTTTEFVVVFTPTLSGDFMREISFQVGGCEEPYVLELHGSVL